MNPIYNTAIYAFANALRGLAPFHTKVNKMVEGHKQTLDILRNKLSKGKGEVIWIHAASLGEFEQGRPLIEKIKSMHPEKRIVLSFFSPSGYEVRKNYALADAVIYLPFDTPGAAKQLVELIDPQMVFFIKYEFWGNYLQELKRKNIPTYLVSSIFRPNQIFFKKYGHTFRQILGCFTNIYVQDQPSHDLLKSINIDSVVAGDTRFDRVAEVKSTECKIDGLDRLFGEGAFTLVVGSSWQADEDIYINWLNAQPEVKFIIAPHEFDKERLENIKGRLSNRQCMTLSEWQASGSPSDVDGLIIDSFGHLSSLYRFADIAYIGGGFGAGIHNINEAAVYGVPILFGPNHKKFKEAKDLLNLKGALEIKSKEAFEYAMSQFLKNKSLVEKYGRTAGEYVDSNIGATNRIYDSIFT